MKASVTKANIFTGLNYSIIGVFTSFEYKNNMKRPKYGILQISERDDS
jgi:hypothetical protein